MESSPKTKTPPEESPILIRLAESCKKHQEDHQNKPLPSIPFDNFTDVPRLCRNCLESLRVFLPTIEKTYRAAEHGHKGPSPLDVKNLCDFYQSALGGIFCPHAPHLFGRGDVAQVLPRVHYLLKHAVSRVLVTYSIKEGSMEVSAGSKNLDTVLDSIAVTVGTFLSTIPDVAVESAILVDLIQTIMDLVGLIMNGDVFAKSAQDGRTTTVQVEILPETVSVSDLPSTTEYLIDLKQPRGLWSLLSTLYFSLKQYVVRRRDQRLVHPEDHLAGAGYPSFGPSFLAYCGVWDDPENIASLFAAVRFALLLDPRQDVAVETAGVDTVEPLMTRVQQGGLQVADLLLHDCARMGSSRVHNVAQLAILGTHSLHGFLSHQNAIGNHHLCLDWINFVNNSCNALAGMHGLVTSGVVNATIETILPPLLSCVVQLTEGNAPSKLALPLYESVARFLGCIPGSPVDVDELQLFPISFEGLQNAEHIGLCIISALGDRTLCFSALPITVSLVEDSDMSRFLLEVDAVCSVHVGNEKTAAPMDAASLPSARISESENRKRKANSDEIESVPRPSDQDDRPVKRRRLDGSSKDNQYACSSPAFANFDVSVIAFITQILKEQVHKSLDLEHCYPFLVQSTSLANLLLFLLLKTKNPQRFVHIQSTFQQMIRRISDFIRGISLAGDPNAFKLLREIYEHVLASTRVFHSNESRYVESVEKALKSLEEQSVYCLSLGKSLLNDTGAVEDCAVVNPEVERYLQLVTAKGTCLRSFSLIWSLESTLTTESLKRGLSFAGVQAYIPFLAKYGQMKNPTTRMLVWKSGEALLRRITNPGCLRNMVRRLPIHEKDGALDMNYVFDFMLTTAFGDDDVTVRRYASRDIGCVLLANDPHVWFAALSDDKEWNFFVREGIDTVEGVKNFASVLSRFFYMIDSLLFQFCNVSQSQLSFSMDQTESSANCASNEQHVEKRANAIESLLSMCRACNVHDYIGRMIFEKSLTRVVRLWSCNSHPSGLKTAGICFAQLIRLSYWMKDGNHLSKRLLEHIAPSVFRDLLISSSAFGEERDGAVIFPPELMARQYRLLSLLLSRMALENYDDSDDCDVVSSVSSAVVESDLVETFLPVVLAPQILDEDISPMNMTTGFRLYVQVQRRLESRSMTQDGHKLESQEGADRLILSNKPKSKHWSQNLEEQTCRLCLSPGIIERILPLVLQTANKSQISFLTKTITLTRLTLREIIAGRERAILKGLVKELGRSRHPELAVRALRVAAATREQISVSASALSDDGHAASDAAARWVSQRFMYLLVNVVQLGWAHKPLLDKIDSVRALEQILMLVGKESSLYAPQIISTLNAAMAGNAPQEYQMNQVFLALVLRLVGVKCLATFIDNVADKLAGENIASIVVSIFPLLDDEEDSNDQNTKLAKIIEEVKVTAVRILEALSRGETGRKLSPYFAHIAFLPRIPLLQQVRQNFLALGIDPDDDATKSCSSTMLSGVSNDDSAMAALMAKKQTTFRKRLNVLGSLLGNENTDVRRVVLKNLSALLGSNQDIFQSILQSEEATPTNKFLTVVYNANTRSRGTLTELVEALLNRSMHETDPHRRLLLAKCLGAIGAIGEHRFHDSVVTSNSEDFTGNDSHMWRQSQPPWQSSATRYELQLVTKNLVAAIKAAETSSDQHKVAHSIQQLLLELHETSTDGQQLSNSIPSADQTSPADMKKQSMSPWLVETLNNAGVLEIVEPFWQSEFRETDTFQEKRPPFLPNALSYFSWLSNWCRFMVGRSKGKRDSQWTKMFQACRTALRTPAGLTVAEFLLPILVLDSICFGDMEDEKVVVGELTSVLSADSTSAPMKHSELQKAINAVFTVIDTFQYWLEKDVEQRYARSDGRSKGSVVAQGNPHGDWLVDEATMRIEDIMNQVPLALQAKAAESAGMKARALRLLEAAARAEVMNSVFGAGSNPKEEGSRPSQSRAAGACPKGSRDLMKQVLAALDDFETMMAIEATWDKSATVVLSDSIAEKEALRDWSGAIQGYEQMIQVSSEAGRSHGISPQQGILRCLVELGQYDSVLNQVHGMVSCGTSNDLPSLIPYAVEASWRLGRWDELSKWVSDEAPSDLSDPDTTFRISLGRCMLAVQQRNFEQAFNFIGDARLAAMDCLALAARDSYNRSYEQLLRLHGLHEIESFALGRCGSKDECGILEWTRRLEPTTVEGALALINVRLALARILDDKVLEGSLFVEVGTRARKRRRFMIASNSFSRARILFRSSSDIQKEVFTLQLEEAKLQHKLGESSLALRLLDLGKMDMIAELNNSSSRDEALRRVSTMLQRSEETLDETASMDIFVRAALKSTKWMMEGGLKSGQEIMTRFRAIQKIAPKWEKGHFHFAKYIETVMLSRMTLLQRRNSSSSASDEASRSQCLLTDRPTQKYLMLAVKHYAEALALDLNHLYQALPRLLSLWFQFTSIRVDKKTSIVAPPTSQTQTQSLRDLPKRLQESQTQLNVFMANQIKVIPTQAFYSAIAQLVSRITHEDQDTKDVVRGMLRRVLAKFPEQAMWSLACLLHSKDVKRKEAGNQIFGETEKSFGKSGSMSPKFFVAARSLIKYLHHLATYRPDKKYAGKRALEVRPWTGEVELSVFLPPVQAALSLAPSQLSSTRSSNTSTRQIPRMRTFSSKIGIMASKARPKKLTAFIVGPEHRTQKSTKETIGRRGDHDLGEIHFLVKQEAKGDLRKDARVQDLNNVINRLMSSSKTQTESLRSRRRLRLRTFAVTCLSEDTGLLEWVPNTDSLRNVVSQSYNPQAPPASSKRRGRGLPNPMEPRVRDQYEKSVQDLFFVSGELRRAASVFEEVFIKAHPPTFYWWFVQKFPNPHNWYEARTRFIESTAAWSAVGHVIGLGDRHAENVLLDTVRGEVVHVDFDCIFDKGLNLPKPEVVPFRLTANMVDAFGPTGVDGVYTGSLKDAMSTLRNNRDTLLSVLEPFLNDPIIDWKRSRTQQAGSDSERQLREAKRSINVIDERLRGIYNLRNPNFRRVQRRDLNNSDDDDLTHVMPLSVEGQVHKLIAEATSSENLVQMYFGWIPWL